MGKFQKIDEKFKLSTVVAVLKCYHALSKLEDPPFRISKTIFAKMDDSVRADLKRATGVTDIISWARSVIHNVKAGGRPTSPYFGNTIIKDLLPLPVIHTKLRSGDKRKGKRQLHQKAQRPARVGTGSNDLNVMVTTKDGVTKIEIETDCITAKRLLAALALED
jgi:hypothetical protein